ncbi:MAG: hypothetical protein Q7J60_06035 [Bradyrhizobium sp.]|nr:hypothetical protein [Bradyrhizobium sp.]
MATVAQAFGDAIAAMVIVSRNATVNQNPQKRGNPHDNGTFVISPPRAPDRRLHRIHREP